MASQVAWLNFDAEQQRRTQLMMMALAEQSTVDELGLGLIRDLIAGTLHPNLTVLLTRARYLVLLPRIYSQLTGSSGDEVRAAGRKAEGKLVRDLIAHYALHGGDDVGIIGRRRGEDAKQPASTNYWPLMRALGVVRAYSVGEFCQERAAELAVQRARGLLRAEDDPVVGSQQLWLELPADEGGEVSFELTLNEAEWLRQLFLNLESPGERRSLLGWMLEPERYQWVEGVRLPWLHPEAGAFPVQTAHAMRLGEDLDRLVHGARILYNWLCSDRCPPGDRRDGLMTTYRSDMTGWQKEIENHGLPTIERLGALDVWAQARLKAVRASSQAHVRWKGALRFLAQWQGIVAREADLLESGDAAAVVTSREATLKPGRARLKDPALLTEWVGGAGYGRFDYNWIVARRLLGDIHNGLGTSVVDAGAARDDS